MDLGVPGPGPGQETRAQTQSSLSTTKLGSESISADGYWRSTKMVKTEQDLAKTVSFNNGLPLLRSGSSQQEHMLSFSSDKSEAPYLGKDFGFAQMSAQNGAVLFSRNAGYGSGSMNTSMHGHGSVAGIRGPFTLSQWVELEQQAMIYKYITANVPVPSSLLLSLKRSLYSYGFTTSTPASLLPNSFGWGTFHLGFSGSTDPEPGRCRRTDGKKWRCSRDAVPDQKYCERHINRGRHRSRKPVEGQTGHAATPVGTASKAVGVTSSALMPGSASAPVKGGGACNSFGVIAQDHPHIKNYASVTANPSADSISNRVQNPREPSVLSSTLNPQPKESTLTMSKENNPFNDYSQLGFGLVSSDSFLNPSHKSPLTNPCKNYSPYLDFNSQVTQDQNQPNNNPSAVSWPDELKSDWTQLTMSIPFPSSEFSTSSSSPAQEKIPLSPLRLSRELEPATQMGLGINTETTEPSRRMNNWIPVSWGSSMGGPLGEVLSSTTNSPQFGSSPTGVLQRSTFGSLSNSSSGSSPVAETKKGVDGVGLGENMLGSTIM